MVQLELTFRQLALQDLARLGDIDRSERIEGLYVQRGAHLELQPGGDWSSPAWLAEGDGQHSVARQRQYCAQQIAQGGVAFGAFEGERMVGIGVVRPGLRPGMAQLAFLHVSNGRRASGVGGRLARDLEQAARAAGDRTMVVSATPSANTVGFYRHLGYEPMGEPLQELFELEPEDIHMCKVL